MHSKETVKNSAETSIDNDTNVKQHEDCDSSKTPPKFFINCYHTNAGCIMNKRGEFQETIDELKPKIIGVTESWCDSSVLDGEVNLDSYTLFRKDKVSAGGGGVLMYVHDSMQATACQPLNDSKFETSVWCEIKVNNKDSLLVGVCYRSPNSSEDNNELFLTQLKMIEEVKYSHILLFGDFNFPEINWKDGQVKAADTHLASIFFDTVNDLYLVQHVEIPTRYREGQKPSTLDLIFTNEEFMVENLEDMAPLGKSDHVGLSWTYVCNAEISTRDELPGDKLNYNKGDYESIKHDLKSTKWEEEMKDLDSEEAWLLFKSVYNQTVKNHIPQKKTKKRYKPPWLSSKVKKSVKKKYNLYKRYRKSKQYKDYEEYKKQNNVTRKIVREAQAKYEQRLMKEFKSKPKAFYSYVRQNQKVKVGVAQLEKDDGNLTENDEEAAEVLSQFFQSVFTQEPTGEAPELESVIDEEVDDVVFTQEDVKKELDKLKPDKSPGPDSVHPKVLKECSEEVSLPLYLIFRKSLDSGSLPKEWKTARVTPIFKKGSKKNAGNYRPVSLTCIPCKIMETILKKKMQEHVDKHGALSERQHGFVKGKSCLTNLLETLEEVTENLDQGVGVDIIFLDYAKAFDSVPHKRLINKLKAYGFNGKVLNWIEDFLMGRSQTVTVRNATSNQADVLSGVPQGSVLGPLLFILYINDLPQHVNSSIQMFADDTKIFTAVDTPESADKLQSDIDKLQIWSAKWLLRFNAGKCKTMHFGNANPEVDYIMDGVTLEAIQEEKDLGVYLTSDCKSSVQCTKAAQKAMNCLRVIKRTFKFINRDSFTILYRAYIRPHLEYCVQAWSPGLRKDITTLEKVQRRATKLVPEIRDMTYEERLQKLKLYTLEQRRLRGDLIETFKILNQFERVDQERFFKLATTDTRGHSQKLFKPRLHKALRSRQDFYSQRVVNHWNSLPAYVINTKNTNSFKTQLDRYWKDMGFLKA
ncbi:uncharacterized protein [Amphiura filiformis]|uniref:uncharacterized protein n=1 Tax=Amphiura filiformis TaxID=82378 RepID=UPI003B224AB0